MIDKIKHQHQHQKQKVNNHIENGKEIENEKNEIVPILSNCLYVSCSERIVRFAFHHFGSNQDRRKKSKNVNQNQNLFAPCFFAFAKNLFAGSQKKKKYDSFKKCKHINKPTSIFFSSFFLFSFFSFFSINFTNGKKERN